MFTEYMNLLLTDVDGDIISIKWHLFMILITYISPADCRKLKAFCQNTTRISL